MATVTHQIIVIEGSCTVDEEKQDRYKLLLKLATARPLYLQITYQVNEGEEYQGDVHGGNSVKFRTIV